VVVGFPFPSLKYVYQATGSRFIVVEKHSEEAEFSQI
jgi:hypothetical protein